MNPHRQRTVGVVRVLRAIGPLRRTPGRFPRQQQPDTIRIEYFKALDGEVKRSLSVYEHARAEVLRMLIDERREQGKMDIARTKVAHDIVNRAGAQAASKFDPTRVRELAEKFGRRTGAFQREQIDRQIRQAFGVPFSAIERPIRDLVPVFASANVELVKSVPERYHDRLVRDVTEAFETGMHPQTLAERFVDLDDMAESDARRIARDQIGKLNASFNQERQQSLGVTSYVWRGAMDNRERDEHRELEGQEFDWDDPPEDGHPGEAIQCRCYADPILRDVVGDVARDDD